MTAIARTNNLFRNDDLRLKVHKINALNSFVSATGSIEPYSVRDRDR
ncbi:hypothetical protein CKA32_006062 [Geitlerinema sp. FC II]|nr:hypothetical protein CKA32_006062 [Geitlerinema sp. FC II]